MSPHIISSYFRLQTDLPRGIATQKAKPMRGMRRPRWHSLVPTTTREHSSRDAEKGKKKSYKWTEDKGMEAVEREARQDFSPYECAISMLYHMQQRIHSSKQHHPNPTNTDYHMGQKRPRAETMDDSHPRPQEAEAHEQSPLMPMFEAFRKELDEHHDRRERTIKASRDVTAASKKM